MIVRPDTLNPLFLPITALAGVGDNVAKSLESLGIHKPLDFLFHLPSHVLHYPLMKHSLATPLDTLITIVLTVQRHERPKSYGKNPYRVFCIDSQNAIVILTYFRGNASYLEKILPVGSSVAIRGSLDSYKSHRQITHPVAVVPASSLASLPSHEQRYPLTYGVGPKLMHRLAHTVLKSLPDLPEWHDSALVQAHRFPSFADSLHTLHHAQHDDSLSPKTPAYRRLAYDELLAEQLALCLYRQQSTTFPAPALTAPSSLIDRFLSLLPFSLTDDQQRAFLDIQRDLSAPHQMVRLLQGDVGSGKTLVAFMSALVAIASGYQVAFMVPTGILATQHFQSLKPYADSLGISMDYLVGKEKASRRKEILESLSDGRLSLIIGTHALFQDSVILHSLGLVIIDEQHRFGVAQRLRLTQKGISPHVLSMTATPIPRSLLLAFYGDIETSAIVEKPKNRKPVDTRLVNLSRLDDIAVSLKRALASGSKVFWVCPLIRESDKLPLTPLEHRLEWLQKILPDAPIFCVHGEHHRQDKNSIMLAFKNAHHGAILLATTVIEVGVDVPDATIIIIEHAERFGLSQLHQLRGRVGRGDQAGTCLLVYSPDIGDMARARLKLLRHTHDGFRLAEEDLTLRGGGDILGLQQSGQKKFRLAQIQEHGDLLAMARQDAKRILHQNPTFTGVHGDALRLLLYLFDKNDSLSLIPSG